MRLLTTNHWAFLRQLVCSKNDSCQNRRLVNMSRYANFNFISESIILTCCFSISVLSLKKNKKNITVVSDREFISECDINLSQRQIIYSVYIQQQITSAFGIILKYSVIW